MDVGLIKYGLIDEGEGELTYNIPRTAVGDVVGEEVLLNERKSSSEKTFFSLNRESTTETDPLSSSSHTSELLDIT